MALINSIINVNGRDLCHHESNNNKYILQVETGKEYIVAVDTMPCPYTYEETDKEIPKYDRDELIE